MCKLAKYVRSCVVFLKTLHSWQEFYTTAGRDGRDKFQVWIMMSVMIGVVCTYVVSIPISCVLLALGSGEGAEGDWPTTWSMEIVGQQQPGQ